MTTLLCPGRILHWLIYLLLLFGIWDFLVYPKQGSAVEGTIKKEKVPQGTCYMQNSEIRNEGSFFAGLRSSWLFCLLGALPVPLKLDENSALL